MVPKYNSIALDDFRISFGVPCAIIEKKNNKLTKEDMIKFCKKYLAGFKTPKKIIFDTLPRTSTGKIQKFNLRKIAKEINA